MMFGYGTILLVVALLILRQTFDRTVLATGSSSLPRHSYEQPARASANRSSGSTFTPELLLSRAGVARKQGRGGIRGRRWVTSRGWERGRGRGWEGGR